jgi:ubiquitin carboxyl-terminal hydrolase 4/11/15
VCISIYVLIFTQARDLETIKRKILEKVATFSTSPELQEDEPTDASVSDSVASDIVLTTGSDADSSGDVKVVANSIDGEDELVDIAMKDTNGAPITEENGTGNTASSESERPS